MVAAINICICARDGRRPSSTPAHFEAPDALGSEERGGRILMSAKFQFRALRTYVSSESCPDVEWVVILEFYYIHFLLFFQRPCDTRARTPHYLAMAVMGQLTAMDLLFPFRDSFNAKVDIDSLIAVMEQNQLLKKKEKKQLQRVDETARKSFVYDKLYSADQSLPVDRLVKLFTDTENEKNVRFSKALLSIVSEAQKSATIGGSLVYMLCIKWLGCVEVAALGR